MNTTLFHILFVLSIMMALSGCATREVVRTEYIATPTYCKVSFPNKPTVKTTRNTDYQTFLSNLQQMLIYTDQLEMALLCCTNSNNCITK